MDCQKLHEDLNDLDTNEPEPVGNPNRDVKWIIRRGKDASKENKHLLKEAVKIFHVSVAFMLRNWLFFS